MIRWTHAFVDRPEHRLAEAAAFWTAATGTRLSAPRGERGEFATLLADGADACLKLQGVGDHGGGHPDLSVDDVPTTRKAALDLGATVLDDHADWAVLRSPGGQPFCLAPWQGQRTRPAVVTAPGGATSRLDQLCLDVSPDLFRAETAFWAALTGWESLTGSRPEFHLLRPPAGQPLRFLLQRLDAARPAGAHQDLACSDPDAVRGWHESLGATEQARGAHWIVMRDPAGGSYCLTGRDPVTGALPVPADPVADRSPVGEPEPSH
ncbi:VOC family protein [Streptacidiphilus cavernicola]|uniref:VOC family protein n=1 Tax=Streptacidiphilus cavernicola TaxID=3342716 RepID=A0ABV6VQN5_9ACTN